MRADLQQRKARASLACIAHHARMEPHTWDSDALYEVANFSLYLDFRLEGRPRVRPQGFLTLDQAVDLLKRRRVCREQILAAHALPFLEIESELDRLDAAQ